MSKIAIIYGSTGGNTENVATKLQSLLGDADLFNVADISADDIASYDNLILGTSTSGIGDLQEDWETFLPSLEEMNLSGKKIALFALGDSGTFSGSFAGSIRVLYDAVADKAKVIGAVADEGYSYDESEGVIDGQWVGLPLDEENEDDLTDRRLEAWVTTIKPLFN